VNFNPAKVQKTLQLYTTKLATRIKILFGIEYKQLEAGFSYDCIPFGGGKAMLLGFFKFGIRLGKMK
jgi:hypothetical protein